ncbi:MAG TPA: purine-nucleoside phosphorylase [Spirochaetales bacterium]|nr:purine-nucleoside phosphorylase [Spirochaetales bacterium]
MSIHISAKPGEIAETVLLPGDPLRAEFVAKTFLKDARCYNRVRGMLGFTGTYQGKRVSIQGTGMGMPSLGIYVHELIQSYGARRLIRIGSCGTLQEEIQLRDVILATSASTNSAMNRLRFKGMDFAPTADFHLLLQAWQAAERLGIPVRVGSILSSDTFYDEEPDAWKLWAEYGVLAVEMESAALYTLAARFKVQALAILTVSDSLPLKTAVSTEERERSFQDMVEIALELVD